MTNNPNLYFPLSPSSSSSPLLLPPNPQKLRKKRSNLIKILLPKPQHCTIKKPKSPYPHLSRPHSCPECFKQFSSEKALYGHMRCHPDRDYRGMIRKPNYGSSASFDSRSLIEPEPAPLMSLEDREVASCLLLLSRTDNSCSFECSSCRKVFGSHQALGGHRASHKNVKGCSSNGRSCGGCEEIVMANLGHKCGICFRVFSTGQALGGHMRCHWEKGEDGGDFDYDVNRFGLMDLNLPADHWSSPADFNLDLRLGL